MSLPLTSQKPTTASRTDTTSFADALAAGFPAAGAAHTANPRE
ncbi:hypothetical protein [Streptomyces sp. NPDC001492]